AKNIKIQEEGLQNGEIHTIYAMRMNFFNMFFRETVSSTTALLILFSLDFIDLNVFTVLESKGNEPNNMFYDLAVANAGSFLQSIFYMLKNYIDLALYARIESDLILLGMFLIFEVNLEPIEYFEIINTKLPTPVPIIVAILFGLP
ncbi:hypothetical protein ACJX0J_040055, partial [Zea mays]